MHSAGERVSDPEPILPLSCWVNPVDWDIDQEIARAFHNHTPESWPHGHTYVPAHLRGKLITWAHIAPASGQHNEGLCNYSAE